MNQSHEAGKAISVGDQHFRTIKAKRSNPRRSVPVGSSGLHPSYTHGNHLRAAICLSRLEGLNADAFDGSYSARLEFKGEGFDRGSQELNTEVLVSNWMYVFPQSVYRRADE